MTPSSKRLAAVNPAWVKTQHLAVLGQHRGGEPRDARLAGRLGQVLEQHGGHAAAVVLVVDEEGHLGVAARPVAVVAGHADQVVADQPDERHAIDVVDVGEALHVALGEPGPRREEAEVDALRRLALVEGHDALGVVGADGTHGHGAAVGEHHLGLPPLRVGLRALRILRHGPKATEATC